MAILRCFNIKKVLERFRCQDYFLRLVIGNQGGGNWELNFKGVGT